jgi:hypothetical protein
MADENEERGIVGSILDGIKNIIVEGFNSPEVAAMGRLGLKELGNAVTLGREGSVAEQGHEYGMPGTLTPGEQARNAEEHDGKLSLYDAMSLGKDELGQGQEGKDAGHDVQERNQERQQGRGR